MLLGFNLLICFFFLKKEICDLCNLMNEDGILFMKVVLRILSLLVIGFFCMDFVDFGLYLWLRF